MWRLVFSSSNLSGSLGIIELAGAGFPLPQRISSKEYYVTSTYVAPARPITLVVEGQLRGGRLSKD